MRARSSAFKSFATGPPRGVPLALSDRDDLWRLLVVITARKACAQVQRRIRQKRGGGRVLEASASRKPGPRRSSRLRRHRRHGATPSSLRCLLRSTNDCSCRSTTMRLRQVALDRLAGYTNDEIAERLGAAPTDRGAPARPDPGKIWSVSVVEEASE